MTHSRFNRPKEENVHRQPDGKRIRRAEVSAAPERRPTMIEVARLAGVSQSSVSMVLNRMEGARITEATRQRVEDAARTLGYELPGRRRLRHRDLERRTIAYLVDEISTSPHPVINLDGARDAGWEQGFLVSAYVTRSDPALEATTLAAILADPSVLGIIYSTIFTRRITPPDALCSLPSVLLNCYDEDKSLTAVLPAEVVGGFTATTYLTELGHTRIGFINGEPWMDAAMDRLTGYRQGLATSDLPFDETLVRYGDWYPVSGHQHALDLLSKQNRPTALFCANDQMAQGALEAAIELGLRVPDDVSILGYDDQELARYTTPPLSTVVLPNYEMGRRAVETLIRLANAAKPSRPHLIKIDGPLVVRGTTAGR